MRADRFLTAAAGAVLLLWVLAWAVPAGTERLWGLHAWAFLSWPARAGVAAAALLTAWVMWRPPPFPSRVRGLTLLAAAAVPVLYLLRDRAHLLGDGQLWMSVLSGPRAHHAHEPLALGLAWLVTAPVAAEGPAGVAPALEWVSVVMGAAWVAVAAALAASLAEGPGPRWWTWGLLAASGTVQFAFGYVEAYPVLWLAVTTYLWLGLLALQGRVSVAIPLVVAAVAVALHGSAALLLPSAGWLWWRAPRSWPALAGAVLAGAAVLGLAYAGLPRWLPGGAGGSSLAAGVRELLPGLAFYPHGLPAWSLDQLNRWMLLAPGALMVGAALIGGRCVRGGAPLAFFLLAAAVGLPALLLDTEGSRGAALDWDAFSVAAVPLSAAAAWAWNPRPGRSRLGKAWSGAAAVLLAGSFVLVNASASSAEARYASLLEHQRWSPRTRAMAWETLAVYQRELGAVRRAAVSYAEASALDPGNHRLRGNAAVMWTRAGEPRRALDLYLELTRLQPTNPDPWYRAGVLLQSLAAPDSARAAFEESIRRGGREPDAYNRLAGLILEGPAADTELAGRLLRESLTLDPHQPRAAEIQSWLQQHAAGGQTTRPHSH